MREKIFTVIYIAFGIDACRHVYIIMKSRWIAVKTRMMHGMTPIVSNILDAIHYWVMRSLMKK